MRYFFHFRLFGARVEDTIGQELLDLESALVHARDTAAEIMRGKLAACFTGSSFEIADHTGRIYLTVPLQELTRSIEDAAPAPAMDEGTPYGRPGT